MAAGLLTAALAESAIITWRDLSGERILPLPSDYVSVAIVYGGLALFPDSASGFASLVGWGFVLATFLNLWNPRQPLKLALGGNTTASSPGGGAPLVTQQGAAA